MLFLVDRDALKVLYTGLVQIPSEMLPVRCLYSKDQASVVQKGDNVIYWINRYPSTYPLDTVLSGG